MTTTPKTFSDHIDLTSGGSHRIEVAQSPTGMILVIDGSRLAVSRLEVGVLLHRVRFCVDKLASGHHSSLLGSHIAFDDALTPGLVLDASEKDTLTLIVVGSDPTRLTLSEAQTLVEIMEQCSTAIRFN